MSPLSADEPARTGASRAGEVTHLRQITRQQWRSGIAAWLGWTFDGLDMHLYTLVAAPFVAQLLGAASTTDPRVGRYGSIIQGGFMLGWALGGGFFGRIGDRLGRSRALSLTVLTYAAFTGLSFFAQTWWHLLIFRFLAALGIGGEWAVGASLLAETWPRQWRPWIAAVLQTGVNVGILAAGLANIILAAAPPRCLFLVGVLPALLVFWIRRAVPETEEWRAAKEQARAHAEFASGQKPALVAQDARGLQERHAVQIAHGLRVRMVAHDGAVAGEAEQVAYAQCRRAQDVALDRNSVPVAASDLHHRLAARLQQQRRNAEAGHVAVGAAAIGDVDRIHLAAKMLEPRVHLGRIGRIGRGEFRRDRKYAFRKQAFESAA